MLIFQKKYFLWAIFILLLELFIAFFVRDRVVRPYGGDFLVVILVYCAAKSTWRGSVLKVAISALLFCYFVEIMQHFEVVKLLGLANSEVARVAIGTSFAWGDILAYSLGFGVILWFERPNFE